MMSKKTALLLLATAFIASFWAACSSKKEEPAKKSTGTYVDYIDIGANIAVEAGDIYDSLAQNIFKATVMEYRDVANMLEALRLGKVNAALLSNGYVRQLIGSGLYPDFEFLLVPEEVFVNKAGPVFHTTELRDKYNEWFCGIAADGTWDEIVNRWINSPLPAQENIPQFEFTGENGTLKVCDTGNYPPLSYFDANGKLTGFDVDMMSRFAQYMGMKLEIVTMAYEAIGPYVVSGKADMSAATLAITNERKDGMIFGEPSVITQAALVVPRSKSAGTEKKEPDYTDFFGKNFSIMVGSVYDDVADKIFNASKKFYVNNVIDELIEVDLGKTDAVLCPDVIAAVSLSGERFNKLASMEVPLKELEFPYAVFSGNRGIIDKYNEFLKEIKESDVYDEMKNRWFSDFDKSEDMPEIKLSNKNGVLKVAINSTYPPFVFLGNNGKWLGFDIEQFLRFAQFLEMDVEFADMDFAALLPYVVSGKADIGASIFMTEERKKSVIFGEPDYIAKTVLVYKQETAGKAAALPKLAYTDFAGKKIGVVTGTICDDVSKNSLNAEPVYYSESSAIIEDVRKGRVDGFMYDLSVVRVIAGMKGNENLDYIEVPAEIFITPMGAISVKSDIIEKFNIFLDKAKADGTLREMQERWLEKVPDLDSPMPEIPLAEKKGVLKIATDLTALPFSYIGSGGKPKGYSIELAIRFAAHEGMNFEFAEMDFGGLIPSVISGKTDFAIANISITEERKKSVLFTNSIYDDRIGIIVLKAAGTGKASETINTGGTFIAWLKTGAERNLIVDNRWKMVVNGLGVTMLIAFSAQIFGTILGCFVCFVLMRKNKFAKWLGNLYCALIHGTPVVVLLMITYYIIFGNTDISNVIVAIAAFTMVMGAGIAQNLKGAIDTIDPVEIEAARSIGFSAFGAFTTVTLPQAVRRALPSYTTGFVELVKATAIVGYIAIQDLTRAADIIRSRTYDAYFPLLLTALIYLAVTALCVWLFKFIIKKTNGGIEP